VSKRKQEALRDLNPKVGVLYNLPAEPFRGEGIDHVAEAEVEEQAEGVKEALEKLGLQHQLFPLTDDITGLIEALRLHRPDVIINLCEGAFGDSHQEMNVPSLLELLELRYTGSPPLTLGICQDKGLTKDVLNANGIPTPKYQVLTTIQDWNGRIDYPLFVKPLKEDASIGISNRSYVRDYEELSAQVHYINTQYRQPALVEEYVAGRELNVAILGNEEPRVLPVSEILFGFRQEPKIVGYSAKWFRQSEEYEKTKPVCPADLVESVRSKVETIALRAYRLLGCRDYARVDIRLRDDLPYVLEVNPNPDISREAGFVRSLKAAGIPHEEFVAEIVLFALARGRG